MPVVVLLGGPLIEWSEIEKSSRQLPESLGGKEFQVRQGFVDLPPSKRQKKEKKANKEKKAQWNHDRMWSLLPNALKVIEQAAAKNSRPIDFEQYKDMDVGTVWGAALVADFRCITRRGGLYIHICINRSSYVILQKKLHLLGYHLLTCCLHTCEAAWRPSNTGPPQIISSLATFCFTMSASERSSTLSSSNFRCRTSTRSQLNMWAPCSTWMWTGPCR